MLDDIYRIIMPSYISLETMYGWYFDNCINLDKFPMEVYTEKLDDDDKQVLCFLSYPEYMKFCQLYHNVEFLVKPKFSIVEYPNKIINSEPRKFKDSMIKTFGSEFENWHIFYKNDPSPRRIVSLRSAEYQVQFKLIYG